MEIELNIQPNEDLFYYYYNWSAGKKNMIHRASCAICKYGTGKRQNVTRGKNGVWIGPFSNLELCVRYIKEKLALEPNLHKSCND